MRQRGGRARPDVPQRRKSLAAVFAAALAVTLFTLPTSANADDTPDVGPFGPVAGYSFDPLAARDLDDVPEAQQPDWWQSPIFQTFFGSGLRPVGEGIESVAVGAGPQGAARVFVSTARTNRVYTYDAVSPAQAPSPIASFGGGSGPAALSDAAGIAYWRGEVFVMDRSRGRPDAARVVVYDGAGAYKRSFPVLNPAGVADMTGIDVAAGEVWVTGEVCGGFGGVVEIFDALTGGLKGITVNAAHAPTGDPAQPCDSAWDASAWWDVAVVPELDAAVAQYRLVKRGVLAALSTPDPEPACYFCYRSLWLDGIDAVAGMKWLLAVDGDSRTARGTGVTEYSFEPTNVTGDPFLRERRMWVPKQSATGGIRDVAYLNRDTRVNWDGPLTTDAWLRGTQCLNYVVSDADIYAVGDQGEHWYEQARGFTKIELRIDGALIETKTIPADQFCRNTADHANGPHSVKLVAYVGGKTITVENPGARFDNQPPTGSIESPGRYATGTVQLVGSAADAHSGLLDPELTMVRPDGTHSPLCSLEPNLVGRYQCEWDTRSGPDGAYRLYATLTDRSSDGGNTAQTNQASTIVDNDPPSLQVGGDLWERSDLAPIYDDERPAVDITATDAGSGIATVVLSVDGVEHDRHAQSCDGGGCRLETTLALRANELSDGEHQVSVVAKDQRGASSEAATWTVDVEVILPTLDEEEEAGLAMSQSAGGTQLPSTEEPLGVPDLPVIPQNALDPSMPRFGAFSFLPCTDGSTPPNFGVYSLGDAFEGLPLVDSYRRCDEPRPPVPIRGNFVSYIYGDCDPTADADFVTFPDGREYSEDTRCVAPLEIQSWPVCERNPSRYEMGISDPERLLAAQPDERITVRDAPAAWYDDELVLEVYTGTTTVAIFGYDPAQMLRAAQALAPVVFTEEAAEPTLPDGDPLDPPPDGALIDGISCDALPEANG